jgi:hypothetical protein
MDAKQKLACTDLWDWNSFQSDIVHSAVNRSQHSRRDCAVVAFNFYLSGNAHEDG